MRNALDAAFDSYLEPAQEAIGPAGIEKLCKDLGLQPTDRTVLLLMWTMEAERMGYLTREEFTRGFHALSVTSIAQMKKAMPKLAHRAATPEAFQRLYAYAFKFCLMEPGQRIIDVATAAEMLAVVHPDGRFVQPFCQFLKVSLDAGLTVALQCFLSISHLERL